MIKILSTIFSIPDLRNKIMFSLGILVVFRIGAHITVPGIDYIQLKDYFASASGQGSGITDYIDLFAGGAFKRVSLFALGIMPYISASIIMQLMMVVVPSLQKLQKEGEYGRKKINQYTRYGTVLLCAAQSYGMAMYIISLNKAVKGSGIIPGGSGVDFILMTMLTITTGTILLMWLGELITEKGIGNGISLLIFAGIISSAPASLSQFWDKIDATGDVILVPILLVVFIGMVALSVLLTEGQRKIPLQYGKRIVGRKMMQGATQSLPIKVNAANVMPIIFASSLMMFPSQIAQFLSQNKEYINFYTFIEKHLAPGSPSYIVIYLILIIFFAYFYTAIQYNPKDIADSLKKNGGYIPGIRPGAHTEEFIQKILNRITLSGAFFLAFIAIAPDLIMKFWDLQGQQGLVRLFGGTSLLIIVGVALDTLKQIESQLVMRHYAGFMDKSKKTSGKPRMVR